MKIKRLSLTVPGNTSSGQHFARAFSMALARQDIVLQRNQRINQIQVPAITARPGETEHSLARRAAAQVAKSLRDTGEAR